MGETVARVSQIEHGEVTSAEVLARQHSRARRPVLASITAGRDRIIRGEPARSQEPELDDLDVTTRADGGALSRSDSAFRSHVGPEAQVTLSDWPAQRQMREIPQSGRLTLCSDQAGHRSRSGRFARLRASTPAGDLAELYRGTGPGDQDRQHMPVDMSSSYCFRSSEDM
ncbi:MAG TPA: hypothetical protein VH307_11395 [Streptosporangiaceae bacterium]|nr:hypothetical protein [Streptosporangiaceae bacterium]